MRKKHRMVFTGRGRDGKNVKGKRLLRGKGKGAGLADTMWLNRLRLKLGEEGCKVKQF